MGQAPVSFDGFDIGSFIKKDEVVTRREVPVPRSDQIDLIDRDRPCPECGSHEIAHTQSSIICKRCGVVIEDSMPENRPGWRIFTEEDKSKIHAEKTRIDGSMTTVIPKTNKDYSGAYLSPEKLSRMRWLSKWDSRYKDIKIERNMRDASNLIRIAVGKLNLSDRVRDEAITFYKNYIKKDLQEYLRGKTIIDLIHTVVYKICKDLHIPYTITEIADTLDVKPRNLTKYYMEMMQRVGKTASEKQSSPVDFIPRFASALNVEGATVVYATKLLNDASKCQSFKCVSMGKEPDGYAAAALYLACLIKGVQPMRKKDTVARATGVAESTIKRRGEELADFHDIDAEYYYDKNYRRYIERHTNRFKK